ncbi:MAG: hypothetical protein ACTTJ7_03045, partial [Treponema sp.]
MSKSAREFFAAQKTSHLHGTTVVRARADDCRPWQPPDMRFCPLILVSRSLTDRGGGGIIEDIYICKEVIH